MPGVEPKTRLESCMQKFKPHFVCDLVVNRPSNSSRVNRSVAQLLSFVDVLPSVVQLAGGVVSGRRTHVYLYADALTTLVELAGGGGG